MHIFNYNIYFYKNQVLNTIIIKQPIKYLTSLLIIELRLTSTQLTRVLTFGIIKVWI